jgi:hypothetical protein
MMPELGYVLPSLSQDLVRPELLHQCHPSVEAKMMHPFRLPKRSRYPNFSKLSKLKSK